jgi:hypothetical protein
MGEPGPRGLRSGFFKGGIRNKFRYLQELNFRAFGPGSFRDGFGHLIDMAVHTVEYHAYFHDPPPLFIL